MKQDLPEPEKITSANLVERALVSQNNGGRTGLGDLLTLLIAHLTFDLAYVLATMDHTSLGRNCAC